MGFYLKLIPRVIVYMIHCIKKADPQTGLF